MINKKVLTNLSGQDEYLCLFGKVSQLLIPKKYLKKCTYRKVQQQKLVTNS